MTSQALISKIYCTLSANQKGESIIISNILMRITSKQLYHEIYHSYITAVSRANSYNKQYIDLDMHKWNFH